VPEADSERPNEWRTFARSCSETWKTIFKEGVPLDVEEDGQAWGEIVREINMAIGRDASLDEFMHRLDITSKEPTPPADAIRLMTIHGAKGKEFETVFVIGLAEGELPSWQSLRADGDAELEEERRNCFVAITRTEEHLYLSYADRYRGYQKAKSRFLIEMGLAQP
jgi:DNA helicase-2/ATP-dependent DNA helicase PcrA